MMSVVGGKCVICPVGGSVSFGLSLPFGFQHCRVELAQRMFGTV